MNKAVVRSRMIVVARYDYLLGNDIFCNWDGVFRVWDGVFGNSVVDVGKKKS